MMNAQRLSGALLLALLLIFSLQGCGVGAFTKGVRDPERATGVASAPHGEYELVSIKGPGTFLSALVFKEGGDPSDRTVVMLDIDGRDVVNVTMRGARNQGLTGNNSYIVSLTEPVDNKKSMIIGLPSPLHFEKELKLRVDVQEEEVLQIYANVIYGR
jgi:hypothetical protein